MSFNSIELQDYNGWVNYPTFAVYSWLTDSDAYPETRVHNSAYGLKSIVAKQAGKLENKGHMYNAVHLGNGVLRQVDVGRSLYILASNTIDWVHVAHAIDESNFEPLDHNQADFKVMENPAIYVYRYLMIDNKPSQVTLRAWAYMVGALTSGTFNRLDNALQDWVEEKLWGTYVPANVVTDLIRFALQNVNWWELVRAVYGMTDEDIHQYHMQNWAEVKRYKYEKDT